MAYNDITIADQAGGKEVALRTGNEGSPEGLIQIVDRANSQHGLLHSTPTRTVSASDIVNIGGVLPTTVGGIRDTMLIIGNNNMIVVGCIAYDENVETGSLIIRPVVIDADFKVVGLLHAQEFYGIAPNRVDYIVDNDGSAITEMRSWDTQGAENIGLHVMMSGLTGVKIYAAAISGTPNTSVPVLSGTFGFPIVGP